jgi:hypothetical protein
MSTKREEFQMKKTRTLSLALGGLVFSLAACAEPMDEADRAPSAGPIAVARIAPPKRVVVVLFDQMVPDYADRFAMPNFRRIRDAGTNFSKAHLGYMASETVIAHNVITSGQSPEHMGWVDEAYRDVDNVLGRGANAMHITGSWGVGDFTTVVNHEGYPKLSDYLHAAYPGTKFIAVGEKSYAVDSAVAGTGDIGVRLSGRSSGSLFDACRTTLGGRYRGPAGKNVPAYILGGGAAECNRFFINSDSSNDYGSRAAFPSWLYPGDGNRVVPGTDPAHLGGDVWVTDAALAMMQNEDWSGMFVTLGAIDKAGHMWGAQIDDAVYDCSTGAGQSHVRCAAEIADQQFGRLLDQIAAIDAARGGETLVVMTADHGATWGEHFHGKTTRDASSSNWYYAPTGTWDGSTFLPSTDPTYTQPAPALAPLIATGNIQFSFQSTALEAWLVDRSPARQLEAAAAGLTLPGATASYYRDGAGFTLYGTNAMTQSEDKWWRQHGQEIVDTLASANGPDTVVLMGDTVSYGVYGDHGGASESVQRVPMVFWSPSLAPGDDRGQEFKTADLMPTVLEAMQIPLTAAVDGEAHNLGHTEE